MSVAGDIEGLETEGVDQRFVDLDRSSALEIVSLMNQEDARVAEAVRAALPAIADAVDAIVERIAGGGRLVYIGAGTSGRLATLDASESVPTFGVLPTLVTALVAGGREALVTGIEGAEDDETAAVHDVAEHGIGPQDAVVGIASSGRTPYVVAALREARERGALTIAVVNNAGGPVAELADHSIEVVTGPEVIAGSTRLKAGTAQKMVLNMLSTASMVRLGHVFGNRMIDVAVTNDKLRARAIGIVADLVGTDRSSAERLLEAAGLDVRTAVLMGRRGVSAADARLRLEDAHGSLRSALEAP